MRESLYDYCTRTRRQALLEEWDVEGNGALTPLALSHGSRRKVWWCCGAGHQWQAAVYTRTGAESGCPYCAGKRPWPGFNDLASQEPALAAQWHPERNGPLTPDQVVCGSTRRVWWQCGSGHVWAASVKSRAAGAGCPYCAGRRISPGENDLATLYPALARQWHPTKNGGLTPAAGVVAVPPRAHMAGGGVLPEPGRRLPGVHGQDGAAGGKRPGHSVSPAGPALGPGEERFHRTATAPSGGGAAWGTAGTRPSAPGPGGATAPTAPGGRSWRGSTTWRPGTPSWPRRGTLS